MNAHGRAPLVSVIMIFWDAETFMDEAIQSVVDQTHPAVELLLCDDGSTDASTGLARSWANRHPDRIRHLEHDHHAHRGMGATRSLGLAQVHGDLVAFLDADDVWAPDHLERHVLLISANPAAAAVCGVAVSWHSWHDPQREDVCSGLPWPSGTVVSPPHMLTAVLRHGGFATPVCSLLVRRRVVGDFAGVADAFPDMYEDQVILAKIYLRHTIVLSDAPTAYYRQHEGSSTARALRRGTYHPFITNRSRETFLQWLDGQPELQGPTIDPDLQQAMRLAMTPYRTRYARLRWRSMAVLRRLRDAVRSRARRVGWRAP